jgi:DNA-binding transcriptional ArsR family regulator
MVGQLPAAQMSDVFKQLSDQSRLSVLQALWKGPLHVNEICKRTGLSQPNVSHHLAQLKSIGLVKSEKEGQMAMYSIADRHVYTILNECKEHVVQGIG